VWQLWLQHRIACAIVNYRFRSLLTRKIRTRNTRIVLYMCIMGVLQYRFTLTLKFEPAYQRIFIYFL